MLSVRCSVRIVFWYWESVLRFAALEACDMTWASTAAPAAKLGSEPATAASTSPGHGGDPIPRSRLELDLPRILVSHGVLSWSSDDGLLPGLFCLRERLSQNSAFPRWSSAIVLRLCSGRSCQCRMHAKRGMSVEKAFAASFRVHETASLRRIPQLIVGAEESAVVQ